MNKKATTVKLFFSNGFPYRLQLHTSLPIAASFNDEKKKGKRKRQMYLSRTKSDKRKIQNDVGNGNKQKYFQMRCDV